MEAAKASTSTLCPFLPYANLQCPSLSSHPAQMLPLVLGAPGGQGCGLRRP